MCNVCSADGRANITNGGNRSWMVLPWPVLASLAK